MRWMLGMQSADGDTIDKMIMRYNVLFRCTHFYGDIHCTVQGNEEVDESMAFS
jgi:hypothetical protein